MKCMRFIFQERFKGLPKKSDFKMVEEELPPLKDGDVLFEALYLSIDPYFRFMCKTLPIGVTMIGTQVARVVESKNKNYKVGDNVVGDFGWRTKTVANPDTVKSPFMPYILPDFGFVPLSAALGVLGVNGNTAWFGFWEILNPKPGETLVVTTAAGAVGSLVVQYGKILGMNFIGFTGSDEKVQWLKEELKIAHVFNYKSTDIEEALKKAAPNGVDCYFDNVGGNMSSIIYKSMNKFGRVSVCGSISSYNEDSEKPNLAPVVQETILIKELKLEGFIVLRWLDRWLQGIQRNLELIKEGKIKFKEDITKGFDKMDETFIGLLKGGNFGKSVVEV
ncbi:prostaglandin reductase 1 isoform X1 [Halyomorpha halys]|uniref:prostaglandin reductase 1 isoform X1 n=1 Tax=Halyomorpha halys TaxID=286706 RepID=UPI0006D4FF73|nr:prostaglandin reductase 1-like [Halyomorpha halys]